MASMEKLQRVAVSIPGAETRAAGAAEKHQSHVAERAGGRMTDLGRSDTDLWADGLPDATVALGQSLRRWSSTSGFGKIPCSRDLAMQGHEEALFSGR